ncbi:MULTISPECIES: fibronectin type III domain-containing protein [unclassified Colwellia]|uniref:fibronectin type III domain-containing protein n=1 Tax=unclassified Colwellia TaxID=196834 RepID=UPI0015F5C30E|nr:MULTISPECIES: fibronectin type III domain-containing protein [unclassified Colwellia]MBA6237274.1 fibronectin type III domain-containing protein [Colwellia sp. MB02u-11]MBA6257269.1 fibronectin type III domain-containing protein [Colwellia sp. MB3u-28]MBA6258854.1 fibronectin type III domain-containing protein [Colwellia sp. MB3u-41]MBA6300518.1 fibronectin type III domain-containing protein [Colwellia sp. MB3u-22]MBA6302855.1 fibronectin type III domain-containing protein [Colwellia sp. MB
MPQLFTFFSIILKLKIIALMVLTLCGKAFAAYPSTPNLSVPSNDSDGGYTVSWQPITSATRYELMGELSGTIYAGTGLSLSRNKPNGTYYYKIRACNANGCSAFSIKKGITVNIPPVPSTPSMPKASIANGNNITVSWIATANTQHYYRQVSINNGAWQNRNKYTFNTVLLSNQQVRSYRYRVQACNINDTCSSYSSASKSISVLPEPSVPSKPNASIANGHDITVSWNATANTSHYYRQVSVNGGAWQNRNRYNTTSILLLDQEARSYRYRVQACNSDEICSDYSPASDTVTAAPKKPEATVINGNEIRVSWVANANHYYRQVSINNGEWQNKTRYATTSILLLDQQERSYRYRVQACNPNDICSDYSKASDQVTIVGPKPIATVTNGNEIRVSWESSPDGEYYTREVNINGAGWQNATDFTTKTAVFMHQQARTYEYRVRVCYSLNDCSPYSLASEPVTAAPPKPLATISNGNDITVSWIADAHHYYRQVSINEGAWQNRNRYETNSVVLVDQQARSYRYRVQACSLDEVCSDYSLASEPVKSEQLAIIYQLDCTDDVDCLEKNNYYMLYDNKYYQLNLNAEKANVIEMTAEEWASLGKLVKSVFKAAICGADTICEKYHANNFLTVDDSIVYQADDNNFYFTYHEKILHYSVLNGQRSLVVSTQTWDKLSEQFTLIESGLKLLNNEVVTGEQEYLQLISVDTREVFSFEHIDSNYEHVNRKIIFVTDE